MEENIELISKVCHSILEQNHELFPVLAPMFFKFWLYNSYDQESVKLYVTYLKDLGQKLYSSESLTEHLIILLAHSNRNLDLMTKEQIRNYVPGNPSVANLLIPRISKIRKVEFLNASKYLYHILFLKYKFAIENGNVSQKQKLKVAIRFVLHHLNGNSVALVESFDFLHEVLESDYADIRFIGATNLCTWISPGLTFTIWEVLKSNPSNPLFKTSAMLLVKNIMENPFHEDKRLLKNIQEFGIDTNAN